MRSIRPLLGPVDMCIYPYYPCTDHAVDQLTHRPFIPAAWAIVIRFLKCNPLTIIWRKICGTFY